MPHIVDLVRPEHTALVTQECQKGVLGDGAVFPQLAEAARDAVPNISRLAKAARAAGTAVVHCLYERREIGGSNNARLFAAARKGNPIAEVIDEIGAEPSDVIAKRGHGIGPMWGTDLDPVLRNLGAKTVVAVGVSVNIGITNLVMDAVNAGYQVVLPRDAVAGIPKDYAEAIIDNTLSLLATLTTTDELLEAWS